MDFPIECQSIVIPNTGQFSPAIDCRKVHGDCSHFFLLFMGGDSGKTYTIQLNSLRDGTGTWLTLSDNASTPADIIVPTTKCAIYPIIPYTFRIAASAAVNADTTFAMQKGFSLNL